LQRDGKTYAFIARLPAAGLLTPQILRRLADVAEKYAIPAIKLSSAQRVVLAGVKPEDIPAIQQDLGTGLAPALGPCVHYVKACPGTTLCRLGKQDSLGLGQELDRRYHGYQLPNKCKIGVSGCINNCAETPVKDIGFVGKPKGWTVMVGGNAASRPQLAMELVEGLTGEQALAVTDRIIKFYETEGKKAERLGRFIERIGFEAFKEKVL
jgi:NAD(P)H-nitrite reductase large subunit